MKNLLFFLFVLCSFSVFAQDIRLDEFRDEVLKLESKRIERVEAYVKEHKNAEIRRFKDAPTLYLYDVINGEPIYRESHNLGAAINTSTDRLITGASGLRLSGEGLRLLIWDSPGGHRETHAEFGERAVIGDFNSEETSDHSTHVSGTILGSGANTDARGMAPNATAVVYNFNNDEGEMANELAENASTMILSNHSYGFPAGWRFEDDEWQWYGNDEIDENEDWKFGFYATNARTYDEFIYNAPYYLIVKSAGNSRDGEGDGTRPPNGPYDQLVFETTAKNIVSVGATRKFAGTYNDPSQIQMSSFSSWGPTDDGRIKPDISAPGVGILSAGAASDDDYINLQGTSMSSPVVMGSLALIQELNKKRTGRFLKAATLKALLLHSAYEVGAADGPDYEFGWGFINTQGMADLLIKENDDNINVMVDSIAEGETNEISIQPTAGTRVKATLVWTDVPGTPVAPQLNPEDLMLVNDLDMRITNSNEAYFPWILDPANPENAATTGDNFRDNVEKIEFVASGNAYTLSIGHKNNITNDVQEYSLVIEYEKENAPKTYYWIGGSGNWEDPTNWSLSSGGTAGTSVPSNTDNVIFDFNSFSSVPDGENFAVQVNGNVSLRNLSWFGDLSGTLELSGNDINVFGDVYIADNNLTVLNGDIRLTPASADARITSAADLSGVTMVVNADNEEVELIGKMRLNALVLEKGKVHYTGDTLRLNSLVSQSVELKTLSATNATFVINSTLNIDEQTTVDLNATKFVVLEGQELNASIVSQQFNATFNVLGTLNIANPASLHGLNVTGVVNISDEVSVNALLVDAGASVSLNAGVGLQVLESFSTNGVSGSLANLNGAENSTFYIAGNQKVCEDFIAVDGIDYTGEATLSIGANSQVTNGQGWVTTTCENTLFADFDFQYGCEAGVTFFENLSSGPVNESQWAIDGNAVAPVNATALSGMNFPFTTEGNYTISIAVEGNNKSKTHEQEITITSNTIEEVNIVEQQDFLIAEQIGALYQWFKDGVRIEGASGRQFFPEESGVYQVLLFRDNCNRLSNEFEMIVTSIEEEKVENAKVSVYPNPVTDLMQIEIRDTPLRKLDISLINMEGKALVTSQHDGLSGMSFGTEMNLSNLTQGIYLLKLVINDQAVHLKKILIADK